MPITRLHILVSSARHVVSSSVLLCRLVAFHLSPLLLHLSYFLAIDLLGFLALVLLKPSTPGYHPRYLDMFFMSTSAATVTGLATVKMEDLSSSQIVVLTLLMLSGSEMFVSFLGLLLQSRKQKQRHDQDHDRDHGSRVSSVVVTVSDDSNNLEAANSPDLAASSDDHDKENFGLRSLAIAMLAYMAVILIAGSLLVFAYIAGVPAARAVLERKGINAALFSASVAVSSFTNGGLLPTNESMAVFAADRGLLLLLAGQILAGGTLLPVFLRLAIWAARGIAARRGVLGGEGLDSMARDAAAAGFGHLLLPGLQTALLAATVVSVAAAAAALLCFVNWSSAVFEGLTAGEKVANAVFMAVNARQAGENSVDCSLLAPAVLVTLLAMMCVPATATFFKVHGGGIGESNGGEERERKDDGAVKKRRLSLNRMFVSPLARVAAVVVLVCVTERRSISGDPLNFSTFNMIFEVVSAYGNVGLSTGYSCSRLLRQEEASACHDKPYSFSGWWSDQGKLVLVLIMLYGRLKGFRGKQRRR
ncbi:unnamed protein product [Urochloa decumbens]|uniref:Uncharacterized protein n=1 Tax=Urochloa decumbens TaxID=240449 RepID=A0ABC8ZVY9_9POAL